MGFLSTISNKLGRVNPAQSNNEVQVNVANDKMNKRIQGIPPDVLHLLWFKDGLLKNIPDEMLKKNVINIGGYSMEFPIKGAIEPSAIGINDIIHKPSSPETVERPPYYPEYSQLSPEQRWIYLNWLKNIDSEINIGYVFIFYYGLERHLFFGDYEAAFDIALKLRMIHRNNSFLSYSSSAMIMACVLNNRGDLFLKLLNNINELDCMNVSPLYLLAKRALHMELFAPEIISLAKKVEFKNNTYIRDYRSIFQIHLENLLSNIDKQGGLDLVQYSPNESPLSREVISANFSLPSNQRCLEVPDISQHAEFKNTVQALLKQTHENVKKELQQSRKDGKAIIIDKTIQNPAREPDPVLKGNLLFEELDSHMFDKNLGNFNNSTCPSCGNKLIKIPLKKGKCKQCGNTILMKNNVFTEEKLLMTEEEASKLTDVEKEKYNRKYIMKLISSERLDIQKIAQRMTHESVSVENAVLDEIIDCVKNHKIKSNFGLARNSLLQAGQFLERSGKIEQAIRFYLAVCYFDSNGAQNGGHIRFNLETAFLAPGVIEMIDKIRQNEAIGIETLRIMFIEAAESERMADMPVAPLSAWNIFENELLG